MELTRFINRSAGMFSGFLIVLLLVLIGCGGDGDGDGSNGGSGGVTFTDAVVFLAQKDDATVTELYVSYDNGTAITVEKLSGTLVTSGQVVDFAISPDGQQVVYKADQQIAGTFELYVVSVIGGTAINVSRQPGNILDVEEFAWSFDSSAIAFRAFNPEPNTGGNFQLFTTLPTGSPVRVSFFTGPNTEVRDFAWSPSSLLLAYTQNPLLAQPLRYDLYSTRPFRQDNNKLSNAPGTGAIIATVTDYAWSPGTTLIAFVAGVDTVGINELFVADASTVNPAPLSLSGALQGAGEVIDFEWRPDNFRVAYSADQTIDNRIDLFTVVVDGSRLPDLVSGLNFSNSRVIDFAWAPNSSRIAFIADRDIVDVFELYTNTSVGNSPRKVSDDLVGGEDVQAFAWSPDSTLIAYQANQDEINKDELYTTSPDIDGDFTKVSGTPTAGGLISPPSFAWSPDSGLIAYIAEQAALSSELYTSIYTPDGITNQAVAPVPLPSGGNVDSFEWEPDSTRVAYLAPQDTINVWELYSSDPDGTDNIKISGDLVTGGNVTDIYEWVP